MKRIMIGVAWPYANGPIHIGQVGGCYLPPDIFRRYHEMKGNEVLMVSGSDQHGTPVTVTAQKEGLTPEETAEKYHRINSKALRDLGVEFSLFTYTMNETHKRVTQDIFKTLYEKDYIYLDTMETFYCPDCERFLPDRYVVGTCPECGQEDIDGDQCDECGVLLDPPDLIEPKCKLCDGSPELRESEHFFLRLSAFQEKLEEYLEDKDYWKNHVLNFTKSWLDRGLEDRPISRDMKWGIPVPIEGYEDKKIYVWFDAVIGYLSTSIKWSEEGEGDWTKFWKDPDAEHYYFLAKDNIPFHTIIWPAMLMGYDEDLNLPYDVPGNQYMRLGGEQFSTSRDLIVSLPDILEDFDSDPIRYYVTTVMPEVKDTNFRWEEFEDKINSELVGNLGNFIHRVLSFSYSNFGKVPKAGDLDDRDEEILKKIRSKVETVGKNIESRKFKKGLEKLLQLSREGNRYLNERAPWEEIKENKRRAGTTLNISLRIVKALCIAGSPYLPHSMDELWRYLKNEGSIHEQSWSEAFEPLEPGLGLEEPEPLYDKIDLSKMKQESQLSESLRKLDLRIGKVRKVEEHPNADRLYVCRVDIGEEERTLVAGLRPYYEKDEMQGKKVLILTNLEPATLRGIKSEGMMLAVDCEEKDSVSLLRPSADLGENIKGSKRGAPKISFDEFKNLNLKTVVWRDSGIITEEKTPLKPVKEEKFKGVGVALIDDEMERCITLEDGEGIIRPDSEVPPGCVVK